MGQASKLHMAITTALRGAGGGGGSQRQPIESPDSLRSIAYARIVDLVSEGEIVGFADQDNPMSCVFLNETPIANADGSLNFKNIQVDSRVGTQTQDYLPNFEGVENEIAIGVELRQETPWVRAITNLNLNAVRVRLSVPVMSKTNTSNGDITGTTVYYNIELQTDGGAFVTKLSSAFTGKTSTKYERTHYIELPPATTGWTIRVNRITANSSSSALVNATYVESYAEIVEAKLRMPMSALVSVIVDAEQFGQIPSRAYRLKGRIVRVPSNYDPDTRIYTGVWDGTFQSRYCNNPAWVFYDMALNTRYGLGHLVPTELVDKWTLYRIAQYCDQLVADGFGGFEPRFTCNLVLQSQGDALKVMQDLATVFRGIIYANGGAITAVGDMPDDPVYTYTPANVIDGKFVYSGSSRKVRHTVALVSWSDLSDFGRAKVEYVDDPEGIARYGIQQTEVIAIGCTSRGQARRWGRYLLATERYETDTVAFGVGLDGTVVAPGKIINIADPLRAGQRRGGRIKSATANSVDVDFMALTVANGDTLVVTLPNGTTERRTIDSIAGTIIGVSENFSAIPVPQSVWAVDSEDIPLATYRVLGVAERNEGDSIGYTLSAIVHIPGKFAYADTGEPIEPPPASGAPSNVVPSPTGLTISQRDVADQNTTGKIVNLSWDNLPVAVGFNVQWRQGSASWMDLGTVGFNNIDIPNVNPGPFEVQVIAINSVGQRSQPTFGGPYDITPVGTAPGFADDLQLELTQEILDRFNGDADAIATAAADATAKANAARDEAIAHADVIAAQLADIVEADVWNSATNYVIGDLVQYDNKLYRALTDNVNQQPDTNPDDWQLLGNYTSLGEAVAASISMGNQNATDIDAVSTQLDAVVARMPAGTGELATSASVATETSARVAADSAAASRLDTLEARMPAGTGVLATASALSALDARVTSVEGVNTSQASAITSLQSALSGYTGPGAVSSAISLLDSRVTAAEGVNTSQASSITSLNASLGYVANQGLTATFSAGALSYWNNPTGAAVEVSYPAIAGSMGGYVLHVGNNSGNDMQWGWYKSSIPFDATKLYRLRVRYRRVSGAGSVYIGLIGLTADKSQFVTTANGTGPIANQPSGSHYAVSNAAPTLGVWQEQEFYFKGRAAGGATGAWTIASPYQLSAQVAHISPLYIANYQDQAGEVEFDYIVIEDAADKIDSTANASAITALDARVTSTESGITANATAITNVKASLGGGGNMLPNTDFEVDVSNWSASGSGTTGTFSRDMHGFTWQPVNTHALVLSFNNGTDTTNWYGVSCASFGVVAGKRYNVSAYLSAHRCNAGVQIRWQDNSGAVLSTVTDEGAVGNGGTNLATNFVRRNLFAIAPAGATNCNVLIFGRRNNSADQTQCYVWIIRPMFTEVGTEATAVPSYSPGTGSLDTKYASATQSLQTQVTTAQNGVNTFLARYTVTLDVNGYVSGFRSENTGNSSNFLIAADKFQIVSPSGGARTEFSSGNWRVYDASGVLRVRMGIW